MGVSEAGLGAPRSWFVMGTEEEPRPSLLVVVAHLSLARGHAGITKQVPEGRCFHVAIDDVWDTYMNPHQTPGIFESPNGMDGEVAPFSVWINYRGWLWALGNYDSQAFGDHPHPEGANLHSFIRAVLRSWPTAAVDQLDDGSGIMEGW